MFLSCVAGGERGRLEGCRQSGQQERVSPFTILALTRTSAGKTRPRVRRRERTSQPDGEKAQYGAPVACDTVWQRYEGKQV